MILASPGIFGLHWPILNDSSAITRRTTLPARRPGRMRTIERSRIRLEGREPCNLHENLILREDTDTAHETIKEAASICENLKPASMAAYYNSQCAGLYARLGDTAGWTKHWELARQNSSTAGSSSNDPDPEAGRFSGLCFGR